MDTLYTFWDSITHYKTESVRFLWAYELSNYEGARYECLGWRLNPAPGREFRVYDQEVPRPPGGSEKV